MPTNEVVDTAYEAHMRLNRLRRQIARMTTERPAPDLTGLIAAERALARLFDAAVANVLAE
jgi:hypothetical protein